MYGIIPPYPVCVILLKILFRFKSRQKKRKNLKHFHGFTTASTCNENKLFRNKRTIQFPNVKNLHLIVCLMNIHIWRRFLANRDCAMKRWRDNAIRITRQNIASSSSYHRNRVIASSPSQCLIITSSSSHDRVIAPTIQTSTVPIVSYVTLSQCH